MGSLVAVERSGMLEMLIILNELIHTQNITFYKPLTENLYSYAEKCYNVSSIVITFLYCES
jgi:hypothetical protein